MSSLCKWIPYFSRGEYAMSRDDFGLADLFAWPCLALLARSTRRDCKNTVPRSNRTATRLYKGVDADSGLGMQGAPRRGVRGREEAPS